MPNEPDSLKHVRLGNVKAVTFSFNSFISVKPINVRNGNR